MEIRKIELELESIPRDFECKYSKLTVKKMDEKGIWNVEVFEGMDAEALYGLVKDLLVKKEAQKDEDRVAK